MIQHIVTSLKDAADEGIRYVNNTIDDVLFVDPEEAAEKEAYALAEDEMNRENSRIDEINAKIDESVASAREKAASFNASFDKGVQKTKEDYREVKDSPVGQMYKAARLVRWSSMGVSYLQNHPEIIESMRDGLMSAGKSMMTAINNPEFAAGLENNISEYVDETTAQICAHRDMMFGAADAGIPAMEIPDTELLLQGVAVPVAEVGLEMAL